MAGYVILELTVFDKEEIKKYKKLVPETIKVFQGEILVRTNDKLVLEGNWNPQRIVIIKFPSVKRAKEWWESELYRKASFFREIAARTNMIILEGEEDPKIEA